MHVLVSGYYGYDNVGDELILDSLLTTLKNSQENKCAVTVLSRNPKRTARSHAVTAINRWNVFRVALALARADIVVLGGGGLFQDLTSSLSLYYYIAIMLCAKALGKRLLVYAVSVNALKALNRKLAAFALNRADAIVLRDTASFGLLQAWGVTRPPLEITADIVFNKNVELRKNFNEKPVIAFILRPSRRLAFYKTFIENLARDHSARIVFVPFQKNKDLPFSRAVMRALPFETELLAWENIHEIYSLFGRIDAVVSERLHGLILSLLFGVPFMAIADDQKILNYLSDVNSAYTFRAASVEAEAVTAAFSRLWSGQEAYRETLHRALPVFKQNARHAGTLLSEFVRTSRKE